MIRLGMRIDVRFRPNDDKNIELATEVSRGFMTYRVSNVFPRDAQIGHVIETFAELVEEKVPKAFPDFYR